MDLQNLKSRASDAFAKGKFSKAAELYAEYCAADPNDRLACLRMGDALAKAGETERAISAYRSVVEGFARSGFLPRAIAAAKLILELDPAHQSTQEMLADLYAQKATESRRRSPSSGVLAPLEGSSATADASQLGATTNGDGTAEAIDIDVSDVESPAEELTKSDSETPTEATAKPAESRFTELHLEEESVLQVVEAAAMRARRRAGSRPRPAQPPAASERVEGTPEKTSPSLPKIPLFSDVPTEAFIALFEKCPLRRFPLGAAVITEGEVGEGFYVVCAGSVRVFRQEKEQRKQIAKLEEGAFFGEMALLSRSPRTASVESGSEETQLLEISAPILMELSARHPSVARALRNFYRARLLANVMEISPLFRPFSSEDRKAMVERFRGKDVLAGQEIIREGEEVQALYVVLSGEVAVRRSNQILLARLGVGDLFGEMSLLSRNPATATVVATRRTSLLYLPKSDFDALISSHPQVLETISLLTDEREKKTRTLLAETTETILI